MLGTHAMDMNWMHVHATSNLNVFLAQESLGESYPGHVLVHLGHPQTFLVELGLGPRYAVCFTQSW